MQACEQYAVALWVRPFEYNFNAQTGRLQRRNDWLNLLRKTGETEYVEQRRSFGSWEFGSDWLCYPNHLTAPERIAAYPTDQERANFVVVRAAAFLREEKAGLNDSGGFAWLGCELREPDGVTPRIDLDP